MALPLALALAVVAAICFGSATHFQHQGVRARREEEKFGLVSLPALIRSRTWLLGGALQMAGIALHLTALALAPISIVQPIGALSLVVVVLWDHERTAEAPRRTWGAVALTCAGVAGLVTVVSMAMREHASGVQDLRALHVLVVVACIVGSVGIRLKSPWRFLLLATDAAVLFGLGSSLARALTQVLLHGAVSWTIFALAAEVAAAAAFGGWLVQHAYAAGPASTVQATTTIVDPLVAVAVGVLSFGEAPNLTAVGIAVTAACALLAIGGVTLLARTIGPQNPSGVGASPHDIAAVHPAR